MNTPKEITEKYIKIGKGKAELPGYQAFLLAIMAGIFIALGAAGANTVACTMAGGSAAKLAAGVIFPAGLAMVLIAGGELFTGNCLLLLPVLSGEITVFAMLKNWVIVYLGNLAGAVLVAWAVCASGQTGLFNGALETLTVNTALVKCSYSFPGAFLLGILCNFLVCIAVWMSFAGERIADKILALFFPIFLFVASGYEHSVANMYYIPAGIFMNVQNAVQTAGGGAEILTWGVFFCKNLFPVTLGNIVGGSALVGGIYYLVYGRKLRRKRHGDHFGEKKAEEMGERTAEGIAGTGEGRRGCGNL